MKKPYLDFPLTPRQDGRWCKKIRGKVHIFAGTWEEALDEYERVAEYLHRGHELPDPTDPTNPPAGTTAQTTTQSDDPFGHQLWLRQQRLWES